MRMLPRAQPDLFVATTGLPELTDAEHRKALTLLQALLTEALMTFSGEPSVAAKETGDD